MEKRKGLLAVACIFTFFAALISLGLDIAIFEFGWVTIVLGSTAVIILILFLGNFRSSRGGGGNTSQRYRFIPDLRGGSPWRTAITIVVLLIFCLLVYKTKTKKEKEPSAVTETVETIREPVYDSRKTSFFINNCGYTRIVVPQQIVGKAGQVVAVERTQLHFPEKGTYHLTTSSGTSYVIKQESKAEDAWRIFHRLPNKTAGPEVDRETFQLSYWKYVELCAHGRDRGHEARVERYDLYVDHYRNTTEITQK